MTSLHPVKIRLRYAELDVFVEKFAPNVTRGGVFLATRHPHPVDSIVAFEVQLAGGEIVMSGQGKVIWVREWNPAEPARAHGIGVQFVSIDSATKPILARILKRKEASVSAASASPMGSATGSAWRTAARGPGALAAGQGGWAGGSGGRLGAATVTTAPPTSVIDTGVDLAAELGVDPTTLRGLIDRTWMSSARSDDDLSELLKPDNLPQATLAQALGDLPRFLSREGTRRRATGRFRTTESSAEVPTAGGPPARADRSPGAGLSVSAAASASVSDTAVPAELPRTDSDITDMTSVSAGHEVAAARDAAAARDPAADHHLG